MALALVDDDVVRCELLLASGEAQARAGDTPGSKDRPSTRPPSSPNATTWASISRAPPSATAAGSCGRSHATTRIWCHCSSARSPPSGRGTAHCASGCWPASPAAPFATPASHRSEDRALSAEALEMARRMRRPANACPRDPRLHPRPPLARAHSPAGRLATELMRSRRAAGDRERVVEGREERLDCLIELGDIGAAKLELEAMTKVVQELRQPAQAWIASVYRAMLAVLEGRFAEAEWPGSARHRPGQRALELENGESPRPPALRASPPAGQAPGGRRPRSTLGCGSTPDLSDLPLRAGANRDGAGPHRGGARRV